MKLSFEGTQEIEFLFYVIICRKHRTFGSLFYYTICQIKEREKRDGI